MILQKIVLSHFRNFALSTFEFSPSLTIIIGQNARGKTNLLESIHFVVYAVGFREVKEQELIEFDQSMLQIQGRFTEKESRFDFQIQLKVQGSALHKVYTLNKSKKTRLLYEKETPRAVLFSPEQIYFMIGPPDVRRKYFDILISFYDPEYKKRLTNYENALRRRNKILEQVRDEEVLKNELSFWDIYLEEQANYITLKRQEYVDFLNRHPKIDKRELRILYHKNPFNQERLDEYFEKERILRRTLIGPQKEDFAIEMKSGGDYKNLHHFGSRSEQRLGVFWLKLNEVTYYEEQLKRKPILLLDDVFSELDHYNKSLVLSLIKNYQTIMTTTEEEILGLLEKEHTIIRL